MNIRVEKVDLNAVAKMKQDYLTTLTEPQDAYWQEGLIGACDHLTLNIEGEEVGYIAVDAQNQLLQFHLTRFHRRATEILKRILADRDIKTAMAATIEPFYFNLCMDLQQKVRVHTYLFGDFEKREPVLETIRGFHFRKATMDDLTRVLPMYTGGDEFVDLETVEAHFGGQLGYAKMVIGAGILHLLEKDDEVLGTGELRVRQSWVPYADVGMIVNPKYRRKGVGTYLLNRLKQLAYQQNLKPICSCEAGNLGSRKAVENAGFITRHRVVAFSF